jgi:hypothetical protein
VQPLLYAVVLQALSGRPSTLKGPDPSCTLNVRAQSQDPHWHCPFLIALFVE